MRIALLTIGLMGVTGLAAAQMGGRYGAGWYGDQTQGQYRLTQDQARKMDEIRAKYEEKLVSLQKELASKSVELEAAFSRTDVPLSNMTALRRQVRDLEDQIEDLEMEANAAAAKILTPDQGAYFRGAFNLFDGGWGWSCPWNRSWRGGYMMSGRGYGATRSGHYGMGYRGCCSRW